MIRIDIYSFVYCFCIDPTVEIDDDADPDYVAADLVDLVDPEELRNVNISRKEYEELFNEFSQIVDTIDWQPFGNARLVNGDSTSTLNTPTKELEEPMRSPERTAIHFDPQTMSTPLPVACSQASVNTTSMGYECSTIVEADQTVIMESAGPSLVNALQWPINAVTFSPMKEPSPVVMLPYAAFQGGNVIPFVVTLPTMPTKSPALSGKAPLLNVIQPPPVSTAPINSKSTAKLKRITAQRFDDEEYLRHWDLNVHSIAPMTFAANAVGFSADQRALLDQQMRMHTQLAVQGFVQTYGHPMLHSKESVYRGFLVSLLEFATK